MKLLKLTTALIVAIFATSAMAKAPTLDDFENAAKAKNWDIRPTDMRSIVKGYRLKPIVCQVQYVIDGDTFKCKKGGEKFSVRLRGIDAPEMKQPHGNLSKQALQSIMPVGKGTYAYIYSHKKDHYGRNAGFVISSYLKDGKREYALVNDVMVNGGYVWLTSYKTECEKGIDCQIINQDFEALKATKKGIWAYDDNVEPYIWRNSNK